jgi:hypothetical protein
MPAEAESAASRGVPCEVDLKSGQLARVSVVWETRDVRCKRQGGRKMTDPKERQEEDRKELDLDEETVRDLEPADDDADDVKGGRGAMCSGGCPTASDCP